jgi:hypothetical protein
MSKVCALSVALALSCGMSVVGCTQSPEPSQSAHTSQPAAAAVAPSSQSSLQSSQPVTSAARSDIYHVHFTKAAPGQAAELAKIVSVQDPKAPMPGHVLVLRHREGDDWDFAVIEHLGTSTTLDIATFPPPGPATSLRAWHDDTFTAGPAWPEFATAMGLTEGSSGNTANSVYVVSAFQAAPGHRDQLEKALAPDPAAKVPVGSVMLQHLEGGTWTYLTLQRFNSWQDFATNQAATAAASSSQDAWADVRQHVAEHHDTLADRLATK